MRQRRRAASQAAVLAGILLLVGGPLAATGPAVAGSQSDMAAAMDTSVEAEREFRERVDQELPGVFNPEQPGQVPLAFFGKASCGALAYATDPSLVREGGVHTEPMYHGDTAQVRERLIEVWTDDIGRDNARTFVDVSIDVFCPSLL